MRPHSLSYIATRWEDIRRCVYVLENPLSAKRLYLSCTHFEWNIGSLSATIQSHYVFPFVIWISEVYTCTSASWIYLSLHVSAPVFSIELSRWVLENRNEELFTYPKHNPSIYLHLIYFHPHSFAAIRMSEHRESWQLCNGIQCVSRVYQKIIETLSPMLFECNSKQHQLNCNRQKVIWYIFFARAVEQMQSE